MNKIVAFKITVTVSPIGGDFKPLPSLHKFVIDSTVTREAVEVNLFEVGDMIGKTFQNAWRDRLDGLIFDGWPKAFVARDPTPTKAEGSYE